MLLLFSSSRSLPSPPLTPICLCCHLLSFHLCSLYPLISISILNCCFSFRIELRRLLGTLCPDAPRCFATVHYSFRHIENTPTSLEVLQSLNLESSSFVYYSFSAFHERHDRYDHNGCTRWRNRCNSRYQRSVDEW